MQTPRSAAAFALMALLPVAGPEAAGAARIQGTVRTDTGDALPGARVTLVSPDTSVVRETRSGPTGGYAFEAVASGSWLVGTSRLGRAYAETLRTVGSADLTQDFSLPPDSHPGRWSIIGDTDPENLYATDSGSLLPDGRILYCHDTEEPVVFDPVSGAKSFPPSSPSQQGCHITTLLADGRLVFVGGQGTDDFRDAVRTVKTFNYANDGWMVLPDLIEERWYPGLARLADGRLLAMGGGQRPNAQRTPTCEIYDPENPGWTPAASMSNASDYPPAVLLLNGRVLRSWWPPQLYDVVADTWTDTGPMIQTNRFWPGHCDHMLVLLPDGRACAVGIYRGSLTNPSMIEIYNPAEDSWSLGANAAVTRSQPEVVMLPTGQVFVAGGRLEDSNPSVPTNEFGQTKLTDIYDPASDSWRRCADMAWFREYHAVTLLVPDGRVVTTAGTGGPAMPGVSNDVEAFEPPYLFRGVRPHLDALSTSSLANGAVFSVNVSRTDSVTRVVFVGTDATTHWVNGGVPRVLSLSFQQAGDQLTVTVPSDPIVAPVGYYILFVFVDDIPSQGRVVRIAPVGVGVPNDAPQPMLTVSVRPNPFVASTELEWYQPAPAGVTVSVLDASGRRLVEGLPAFEREGWHHFTWDGRDHHGHEVPPGHYWFRLKSDLGVESARITRIR